MREKEYKFKFGKKELKINIDEKNILDVMIPKEFKLESSEVDEVKRSLNNPINSEKLENLLKSGEKIAIITSDITRPMPSHKVLPPVIERLKMAGIEEEDITIYLALGSHRNHTDDEKMKLVGKDIYESKIKIVDSDVNNCITLGKCKNGTIVDVLKPVYESDRIICLGNIEYHYFAGYSGGAKAVMPGVSSWDAIQSNHKNMIKSESKAGNLETNPVRQDIDQIGEFIKIDFIVNVILNKKKEIVKCVSGHFIDAHREGCKILDSIYGIKIDEQADIVIVSPGGYPKDINLYQSQKALDNSKHAVKEDGIIIWVASAKEKFGEETFESWMLNKKPDEMIKELKKDFKLGAHKATAIAKVLKRNKIYLVSDLEDDLAKKIGFKSFKSIQEALDEAIDKKGKDAKITLMPYGGSTLPIK